MTDDLMTVDEVAELLGTSADIVLFWKTVLSLPSHDIGPFVRFKRDEIELWIKQHPNPTTEIPTWNSMLGPQVQDLDISYFYPPTWPIRGPSWLESVFHGDFTALPNPLTWGNAQELAILFNGYELALALGLGEVGEFANARADSARRSGKWTGSAIELWLCLFFEQRRWRHFDTDPDKTEKQQLNSLCDALRKELITESYGKVSG